jgi:hypothetical protein
MVKSEKLGSKKSFQPDHAEIAGIQGNNQAPSVIELSGGIDECGSPLYKTGGFCVVYAIVLFR